MHTSTQFKVGTRRVSATRSLIATTAIALLCSLGVKAEETASKEQKPGEPPSSVSTFTIPKTLSEGRDPFHPTSTRVIAMMRPPAPEVAPGPATLTLKGISGTTDRPLALINNQTFAEGDEQVVITPEGKVTVMCMEIKLEGSKVTIKAQGQTRELMLRKGL